MFDSKTFFHLIDPTKVLLGIITDTNTDKGTQFNTTMLPRLQYLIKTYKAAGVMIWSIPGFNTGTISYLNKVYPGLAGLAATCEKGPSPPPPTPKVCPTPCTGPPGSCKCCTGYLMKPPGGKCSQCEKWSTSPWCNNSKANCTEQCNGCWCKPPSG